MGWCRWVCCASLLAAVPACGFISFTPDGEPQAEEIHVEIPGMWAFEVTELEGDCGVPFPLSAPIWIGPRIDQDYQDFEPWSPVREPLPSAQGGVDAVPVHARRANLTCSTNSGECIPGRVTRDVDELDSADFWELSGDIEYSGDSFEGTFELLGGNADTVIGENPTGSFPMCRSRVRIEAEYLLRKKKLRPADNAQACAGREGEVSEPTSEAAWIYVANTTVEDFDIVRVEADGTRTSSYALGKAQTFILSASRGEVYEAISRHDGECHGWVRVDENLASVVMR